MIENILDKLKKRAKETKKFWWEAVKEIKIENISCPNCGWTRDDLSSLKSCPYCGFVFIEWEFSDWIFIKKSDNDRK